MSSAVTGILRSPQGLENPGKEEITRLLLSEGAGEESLFVHADRTRELHVGNDVHLRGIVEFSNHCVKNCLYCGLRRENTHLERYRMTPDEIVDAARVGARAGLKTIVLQSGEDPFYTGDALARIIGRLKEESGVAVTMSVGDRSRADYALMREAGADRYLLKAETADPDLFAKLRPGTTLEGRVERLKWLKELGFQVGSGNMIGLPGQSIDSLADDILLLKEMSVGMAGIGPFIPHGHTPLAECAVGSVEMTLKTIAVARIMLPYLHLPATTALGSMHPEGQERALKGGANVVMPDITPLRFKRLYEIYPHRLGSGEEGLTQSLPRVKAMIEKLGRSVATDYGHERPPWSSDPRL